MAQGTRGRWVRVAATGLGVLVCSGLVGCMGTDKDKDKNKIGVKPQTPTPGLYGTPSIPNGTANRAPAPSSFGANGIQPAGGFGQSRVGTTGQNTLNTSVPQPNFGNGPSYGTPPSTIGAPGQPGFVPSVQPAGYQPTGGTVPNNWNGANTNPAPGAFAPPSRTALSTPPAVQLTDVGPIPPAPPSGNEFAGLPGANSLYPVAPPQPIVPPVGSSASNAGTYSGK